LSTTDAATEIVADVAEEVADQATHIAEVSRGLAGRDVGLTFSGLLVGVGLGGALGYILTKRKLTVKYHQIAAEEVAEMRQHYNDKTMALENREEKTRLEEVIRDSGYSSEPPMAVTPPTSVVDAARDLAEEEAPQTRVEEVDAEPEVRNIFHDNVVNDEWDYHRELAGRSPLRPYVIHRDERDEQTAYDSVTYTYYEEDDVLCNESDEPMSAEDRERVLGETNLNRFGHGSGDANIVYIRNDQLDMDCEVIRSPNSYTEEVCGFEPEIRHADRRRGRMLFDDE
jgi:hypothetical protein